MRVILIRHGDAASSSPLGDVGRSLSVVGRQQAAATGRALASHAIRPSQMWTSPLVRAVQTAELVVAALDYAGVIEARDDLYSDSEVDSLLDALARLGADETVIVVGHQPFMSVAASALLRCTVSGFRTGAAMCMQVVDGNAELEWRWPG